MLVSWLIAATVLVLDEPKLVTVVGTGEPGYSGDGGPATKARLNSPFDVAYDVQGNLFLSDTFNHCIRRVDARTGIITTVAGTGTKGFSGDGGPATSAKMDEPYGLAIDRDGTIYVADRLNRRVRRIDGRTGIMTTVAGDGSKTYKDGAAATSTGLIEPNGVALDGKGGLFIADVAAHRVCRVDLADGRIETFAGTGKGAHEGDGGPARKASIFGARAVEVGPDGTVYILERQGNSLRAVDPKSGIIRTIAGTGRKGFTGDGGPASAATFDGPKEFAIDAKGTIAIVDTENHTIRLIPEGDGPIRTVAGDGRKGGTGDDGPATRARLDRPHGVAFAPGGGLVIGDTNNHRIRMVLPESPTERRP